MEKINYYQEYIALNLAEMNELKEILTVNWCDVTDEYNGDAFPGSVLSGVYFEDIEGNIFTMGIHDPQEDKRHYEVDCLLLNYLLQRAFRENNIHCPYSYPIELKYICGLVNDARNLFRMKNRGEDLSEFKFQHCLLDMRKEKLIDVSLGISENWYGVDGDLELLIYWIEHA